MSLPGLFGTLALLVLLPAGLGWPLARRLRLEPAEQLAAAVALSLVVLWLAGWAAYVGKLPAAACWLLPAAALAGVAVHSRSLRELVRDPAVRSLLAGQALVSAWCLGCLSLVLTYSGGGWSGDWLEHWERTKFFLEHGAPGQVFLGQYTLPARPPLANVVTGVWLNLTARDFAHYQVCTTLWSSLVFLPAALLARRFAGPARATAAVALLAPLLMLNPLFVQNATFAWTKLPAAFFILTALVFLLRRFTPEGAPADSTLTAVCLAAALLTHFSAGPYVVVVAVAWCVAGAFRRGPAAWWRETAVLAAAGGALLATWFAWSWATYGAHTTFLSNSSVTAASSEAGHQLARVLLNLRDTLVPHFLRAPEAAVVAQDNRWGRLRDGWFQLHQLNLFFAFGSLGWLVVLRATVAAARQAAARTVAAWTAALAGVVALGTAVHGARDTWGLTHICLQAFVVSGLAFLAAHWTALARPWRLIAIAGLAFDAVTGIALHLAVEGYALDRWFPDGRPFDRIMLSYTDAGRYNIIAKAQHHLDFFADVSPVPASVAVGALALTLALAVARARRALSNAGNSEA